jgi:hypothetical protein
MVCLGLPTSRLTSAWNLIVLGTVDMSLLAGLRFTILQFQLQERYRDYWLALLPNTLMEHAE